MLEKILKLYTMYMLGDVRSPLPHLIGPPGCGKSTSVEQAAEIIGRALHIINVSRLSPLEVEGVQMPHGDGEDMVLRMLPATFWASLREGDILLLDEFLRGFPEVYNALLDILTSRRAGAYRLPKVFIIAASNSATAYDAALEDRLLHLPVPDPRRSKTAKANLSDQLIDRIGLMPSIKTSYEMSGLLDTVVLPMFDVLDTFTKGGSTAGTTLKGKSVRNLIGQANLREVQTAELKELIQHNNREAVKAAKWQYMVLLDGKNVEPKYIKAIPQIPRDKLTPLQLTNLQINEQLIQMETVRSQKEGTTTNDDADEDEILGGF